MIRYGRQNINQADIDAVIEVLQSDWLTQGPAIERFEQEVAHYCGAKYAVAVSNATAALHISCLAAGLKPGDILWTSTNTFVASANCGLYCGANIDFVDIDPCTYDLGISALEKKLAQAERQGKLPRVIIPVHFAGQSCEMECIAALSKQYGFSVIEDASHAIGGHYQNNPVGSCAFSEMTVLSFHPVKIITTGEGGMVLTNRKDLYEKLVRLRSHGITRDTDFCKTGSEGEWYYQQIELGFNYRITDIQAALGTSQMQRLNEFVTRRHHLVSRYNSLLHDLPLILPWQHPDTYSANHLYVVQIKADETDKDRRQVFNRLLLKGIQTNVHYIPVHTQPYYQKMGFSEGDFPEAERFYKNALTLPLHYGLTEQEQDLVVASLKEILQ
jgi:UDP-4-amino-4,6-dideoxy-N-acetyl-beta-L-altrosamine transaminase